MPVTKQAIKKVRQDRRKTIFNLRLKKKFKTAVTAFRKSPSAKALPGLFSILDKAAKTNVIHFKKASRLKARLSKILASKKVNVG